ncbi:hypothetical protein F7725_022531 [Dissostichus mawsoni]|uniref:Uncharacterized protein n=1 Tax=Dissostichus mawsoni TaxID=36200 RepID=A0A7J5YYI7_DISMA|nr:hypothetical protein F7725_022531 [Dissostichus mawsoni]
MADFPSKVTTETSSTPTQSSQQGGNSLRGLTATVTNIMDMSFIRGIPAILMMVEIPAPPTHGFQCTAGDVCGSHSVDPHHHPLPHDPVQRQQKITFIPWPLTFFGAVVTVAYGASAFFSYLDWKGDGGNAATNTVPT